MSSGNGKVPMGKKSTERIVATQRSITSAELHPAAATPGRRSARKAEADRRRLRTLLFAGSGILIAVVVIVAIIVTSSNGASGTRGGLTDPSALKPGPDLLAVGSKAPDFTLSTIDGQQVSLSGLSGHPVLLEFFAIWCPHCQNESTALNQIDQNFAASGEKTVAILANPYGKDYDTSNGTDRRLADKNDLTWFETTFGVKHPSLIDPTFAVVNEYNASSYPSLYIIDGSGIVRFAQSGEVPYQDLANALSQLH